MTKYLLFGAIILESLEMVKKFAYKIVILIEMR